MRWALGAVSGPLAALSGTGVTNLDQTNALVWTMIGIGSAGAIVTFAFLVYALWKFRDPNAKGRRYG